MKEEYKRFNKKNKNPLVNRQINITLNSSQINSQRKQKEPTYIK